LIALLCHANLLLLLRKSPMLLDSGFSHHVHVEDTRSDAGGRDFWKL
jgi:hypothetical protein